MDVAETRSLEGVVEGGSANSGFVVDEEKTPYQAITTYNNFYEFSTSKTDVARLAEDFKTNGWRLSVEGMVHTPRQFDLDDLRRLGTLEERVYRMRCVEAWSMVIPWAGLPLAKLFQAVEPMGSAKYVAIETLLAPDRMPGQKTKVLEWPYVEGLRIDEAMHPLTILAMGIYGRELPPQDGARCDWWCRGSTDSRESSRSSRSRWWIRSRRPLGIAKPRMSTASTPT